MEKFYSENINEILNSVDGIQRANPSPYFFSKLMNKMELLEEKKSPSNVFQFRPALVIGLLAFMIGMNTFLLIKQTTLRQQSSNQSSSKTSTVNDFSSDYNLNTTSVY